MKLPLSFYKVGEPFDRRRKVKKSCYGDIRTLYHEGVPVKEISKRFSLSVSMIYKILNYERAKEVAREIGKRYHNAHKREKEYRERVKKNFRNLQSYKKGLLSENKISMAPEEVLKSELWIKEYRKTPVYKKFSREVNRRYRKRHPDRVRKRWRQEEKKEG